MTSRFKEAGPADGPRLTRCGRSRTHRPNANDPRFLISLPRAGSASSRCGDAPGRSAADAHRPLARRSGGTCLCSSRHERSTSSSATFCFRRCRTCRPTTPVPGDAVRPQRRVRDLATHGRQKAAALATIRARHAQWRSCGASSGDAAASTADLAVSEADRRRRLWRLPGRPAPAGPRRAHRRRHRLLRARNRQSIRMRTSIDLHRLDGLAPERGRHAVLLSGRSCRSIRVEFRASRLAIVGRNADARGRAAAPTRRRAGDRDASTMSAVHEGGGRLRRAAAHRRRHAAEDLRRRCRWARPWCQRRVGAEGLPVSSGRARRHRRRAAQVRRGGPRPPARPWASAQTGPDGPRVGAR